MYDVKYFAKHLRTTIAEISYLLISFKITYDAIRLPITDMMRLTDCSYGGEVARLGGTTRLGKMIFISRSYGIFYLS